MNIEQVLKLVHEATEANEQAYVFTFAMSYLAATQNHGQEINAEAVIHGLAEGLTALADLNELIS